MLKRIPSEFINDLIDRVDIVELISNRITLNKRGQNHTALCPFHVEKTPSFSVNQQKQFYYCFGCGAHGNAIGFIIEYQHLEFPDAVKELAQFAGVEVPMESQQSQTLGYHNKQLYKILEQAARYFQQQLREPINQGAVDYLKSRGLSGEIARDFSLGFAPVGYDNLKKAMGSSSQINHQLVECGLLIKNEKGHLYDRFRDRIIFPIKDRRGRIIAFGGRIMNTGEPKYLNSPETPVYEKRKELYGLHEAIKAHRQLSRLIVVEGYMDVIALAQLGVPYAVATLGTAVTPSQVETLQRNCKELIFCFDGDKAGRKAAFRAMENCLVCARDGNQTRFLFLPEGEDPDSLIRLQGLNAFIELQTKAIPLSDFFFKALLNQTDRHSLEGKAKLVELAKPMLAKMPDNLLRQLMMDRLAQKTGVNPSALQAKLRLPHQQNLPSAAPVLNRTEKAILYLMQWPELVALVEDIELMALVQGIKIEALESKEQILLAKLIEFLTNRPQLKESIGGILASWDNAEQIAILAKVSASEPLIDKAGGKIEFLAEIERLKASSIQHTLDVLIQKSKEKSLTNQEKMSLRNLLAVRNKRN